MAVELSRVPQEIKELFGSEQTSALVSEISDRLNLGNPRPISRLLFLLETKKLPAHDFVQSLVREAKISESEAGSIAKEIKERILESMRYALFQWGIDISDIKVHDAPSLKDIAPREVGVGLKEKNVEISEIGEGENAPVLVPIQKSETEGLYQETTPLEPGTPFILHEEKKTETASGGKSIFRGFSIPLGFFKPKNPATRSDNSSMVKIETPEKTEKRVVNYSELRTSLSPFEGQQSFINIKPSDAGDATPVPAPIPQMQTETAAPAIPAAEIPRAPEPAPAAMPEKKTMMTPGGIATTKIPETGDILGMIKKTQPKVEGNVIDLS
ncbi:MAG: hypothetical protein ABSF47_02130 [Minisyncoccia bacterium]|jgi:hypothetical protein